LPPVLAKLQHLRWPPLPPLGMNKGKNKGGPRFKQPPQIHNAKKLPVEYQVIPVHRLDRDTSGLMLFARSRAAEQKLTGMFRRHTISREYVGVCLGHVAPQTIESQLVRDRGDGIRGSLNASAAATNSAAGENTEHNEPAGQRAITHVVSAEHFVAGPTAQKYSLIRCRLETGRTHQIRIHLSEAGHMLCGDKIYFRNAQGALNLDPSRAPRHALHSDSLSFTHPFTGQHLKFTMPPASRLSQLVEATARGRLSEHDQPENDHCRFGAAQGRGPTRLQ
jgi:23S rRNA pseudouridine1911/1915/1917 synthase